MANKRPTREEALNLLKKYNQNESLLRHAYAVEAVMEHFADLLGEDREKWGVIGLVHDLIMKIPGSALHKGKRNTGGGGVARRLHQSNSKPWLETLFRC